MMNSIAGMLLASQLRSVFNFRTPKTIPSDIQRLRAKGK